MLKVRRGESGRRDGRREEGTNGWVGVGGRKEERKEKMNRDGSDKATTTTIIY
jgi:hypothetical protein